jgi:hypothetical protein
VSGCSDVGGGTRWNHFIRAGTGTRTGGRGAILMSPELMDTATRVAFRSLLTEI